MEKYYIYILKSNKTGKYYIGYSPNVQKRLEQHNSFENKGFTGKHQPWELKKSFFAGNDRGTAMKIERFIKKQKSTHFIEKVIKDPYSIEKIAQLVRIPRPRD